MSGKTTVSSRNRTQKPLGGQPLERSVSIVRKPSGSKMSSAPEQGNKRNLVDRLIAAMIPILIVVAWQILVDLGLAGTRIFPFTQFDLGARS